MNTKFAFVALSTKSANKQVDGEKPKRIQTKVSEKVENCKAICAYCGKEFEYKPSYGGTHTYCSNACATAAKKS